MSKSISDELDECCPYCKGSGLMVVGNGEEDFDMPCDSWLHDSKTHRPILNLIEREKREARIDEVKSWLDDIQAIIEYRHSKTTKQGMTLTPTKSEFYLSEQSLKDRLTELRKEQE